MELKLLVVLQKPTAGVDFGLQKGSGGKYEAIQIQRSKLKDLYFNFAVGIKGDRQKNAVPGFTGSFVQG